MSKFNDYFNRYNINDWEYGKLHEIWKGEMEASLDSSHQITDEEIGINTKCVDNNNENNKNSLDNVDKIKIACR
ncbi:unnamed protein product [marine sediment metagenome]|uniref:Uncharacterized protein n=1 Tax=marine sediment metagenome TaxID=412755 RepID=X0YEC3_9ZZZZ